MGRIPRGIVDRDSAEQSQIKKGKKVHVLQMPNPLPTTNTGEDPKCRFPVTCPATPLSISEFQGYTS